MAGDEIAVTKPAAAPAPAPAPAAIAAPSAGAPAGALLSRSPTGRADWHAEVTAYQTAVDGILGELRDEVTNLRAARTRDREQIAETMVGLLRHLTDMGAALEHGRGRCHQIASDRRSTCPPAGAAAGRPGPDRRQWSDPCRLVDHRPGDHALGGAAGSFGNPPPTARILAAFVRCWRQTPAKVPAAEDYPASSLKITA